MWTGGLSHGLSHTSSSTSRRCVCACVYVCVHVCLCLCMRVCMCACVCVSCMYYSLHRCVQSPEKIFSVHVSYLEIYNEHGYDLLDPRHEASKLDDLPSVNRAGLQVVNTVITCLCTHCLCSKVSLMESPDGTVHLKNLSLQPAVNEEEGKVSE